MINDQREERQVWDVKLFYYYIAETFCFVLFCFVLFVFCFFAEIRKKGVKKECLTFSCKINGHLR